MGGEGSMAAANASLKNNRNQLAKRKDSKALSGSYAHVKMKDLPKASTQSLKKIREQIQRENETARKKVIVGFVFLFIGVMAFLYFLLA
ncbi:hypothetical protein [Tamlana crocina]|uniref:Uncharacterized protein n=1 Tax=Tamlana crocina TaxID=393006 RepID=A0ABX1DCQ6_9FLAO|nr:hypothetical protein [Tamlana crocina]NJX16151.1 hypothetical protein [Tamlana crocina]